MAADPERKPGGGALGEDRLERLTRELAQALLSEGRNEVDAHWVCDQLRARGENHPAQMLQRLGTKASAVAIMLNQAPPPGS